MRLIIEPNYEQLSRWAANYVIERVNAARNQEKPFVLGLPTGSSPEGMYAELVMACKEGRVSFKNVVTFNMDEYVGLPESHPQSYHSFMAEHLFNHIDCPEVNIHILKAFDGCRIGSLQISTRSTYRPHGKLIVLKVGQTAAALAATRHESDGHGRNEQTILNLHTYLKLILICPIHPSAAACAHAWHRGPKPSGKQN